MYVIVERKGVEVLDFLRCKLQSVEMPRYCSRHAKKPTYGKVLHTIGSIQLKNRSEKVLIISDEVNLLV